MPNESFTLRQVDQARADFASIESGLEFIMEQLARMPTRTEIWRAALLGSYAEPVWSSSGSS